MVVVVVCHVRARPHLDVESQLEGFGEIKKEGITRIAKGRGYDTGDDDDGSKHQHVTPLNIRDELVLFEELGQTPICLQIAYVFGLLFGFISVPNSHRPIVPSFTTCINFDN